MQFISRDIYGKNRAPDNVLIFICLMPISSPNPMFDHLLESSNKTILTSGQQDDSNKWPNIGFGEERKQVELIEVHFMHLNLSSGHMLPGKQSLTQELWPLYLYKIKHLTVQSRLP